MRKYELIVIYDAKIADSDVASKIEKLSGFLQKNEAEKLVVDNWGRRDLAYQIKKHEKGTYVCIYFSSNNGQIVDAINSLLRIDEDIFRFQTHKISDRSRKFKGRIVKEDAEGFQANNEAANV